jgi:hypothetical protein
MGVVKDNHDTGKRAFDTCYGIPPPARRPALIKTGASSSAAADPVRLRRLIIARLKVGSILKRQSLGSPAGYGHPLQARRSSLFSAAEAEPDEVARENLIGHEARVIPNSAVMLR